jgi:hypothetical protein
LDIMFEMLARAVAGKRQSVLVGTFDQ